MYDWLSACVEKIEKIHSKGKKLGVDVEANSAYKVLFFIRIRFLWELEKESYRNSYVALTDDESHIDEVAAKAFTSNEIMAINATLIHTLDEITKDLGNTLVEAEKFVNEAELCKK